MINIPDSIFPMDGEGRLICPKCRILVNACVCPSITDPSRKPLKLTPSFRIEKSGRKGKVVTVIDKLPCDELLLKDLSKKIKNKTATGGTFYISNNMGTIEIQGDHLKMIKDFFKLSK